MTEKREQFPWDAAFYFGIMVASLVVLAVYDWGALAGGLAIAVCAYQLGQP